MFKNVAGFDNNLKGLITKLKYLELKQNFQDNQLTEFASRGFIKVEDLYNPELIDKIKTKYNQVIEDDKYTNKIVIDDKVYCKHINRGLTVIPEAAELVNDKVRNLLQNYYRGHFKVMRFYCGRNYHIPKHVLDKQEVYANRWHCDGDNTTFVKLFVYLSDVTEMDGPFHIQRKKRTKELIKMGFGNRNNYKIPVQELEKTVTKLKGQSGTVFMCNCQLGMHRAGVPNTNHYRDHIVIQFGSSNKPLPKDWVKNFFDPYEAEFNAPII